MTILPVGRSAEFHPERMALFFPVVGLILGFLLAVFDYLASGLWPRSAVAVLDVVLLIVVTGAFHLDGLGDAADGLLGPRSREKALAIMKDSRIGAMGLIAVVCGLATKWAGISSLETDRYLLLIIVPAYARGAQIFGIRYLPYGRPSGTGHALFGSTVKPADFVGMLVPVALSCLMGWRGLLLNICFIAMTYLLILFYKRRLGCITGDMLGAMTEITEPMLFMIGAITLQEGHAVAWFTNVLR
jgi:adenosylcobinamide-GDP ribazoletransferase